MRSPAGSRIAVLRALALLLVAVAPARAQEPAAAASDQVTLDFQNAELTTVIDTIARVTGRNFIYDDRVRGRVTIISPTPMSADQAYAVFESVLQVKGFTTVETPGGALKVIPLREAKETSVQTSRSGVPPPNRDTFITRLIPLRYIDAESIVNTLKPLVSKDAAMAAYQPTNTVILTESASNIRRLIAILENIDIETYREELAVLRVEFADAATLAEQLSEIFGAELLSSSTTSRRSRRATTGQTPPAVPVVGPPGIGARVRIITDDRTNSLVVLAPRTQLEEVRRLVRKLDLPVTGGGRVHVFYLQHADAEELANTLTSMLTGQPSTTGGRSSGAAAGLAEAAGGPALRAQVSELAGGISVTADIATNALIIQASQEGFSALEAVIKKLDVARPQVLVEALIMEVDITDGEELGFNALVRIAAGDTEYTVALASDAASAAFLGGAPVIVPNALRNAIPLLGSAIRTTDDTTIQGIIRAAATDAGTNIISAPHILTSDNEEAEIRIGDNIPIISSRVEAPTTGGTPTNSGLSTSVNVERQDIGVTLRVTPQITEGDTLRLDIFQEITAVNKGLQADVGDVNQVGPALSNRRIENTVVVADGETVVIGGLIGEDYQDTVSKVPWLGDIPFLGWAFKSTSRTLQKRNLLVFLTPHIVRSKETLIAQTIRKREQFVDRNRNALNLSEREQAWERREMRKAQQSGEPYEPGRGLNPVRHALLAHEKTYPLEQMREIEQQEREAAERRAGEAAAPRPAYYLQAGVFRNEAKAVEVLTTLVDLGFDGDLQTGEESGQLVYEVRVGPYAELEEAERAFEVLERSEGLSPAILIQPPQEETP